MLKFKLACADTGRNEEVFEVAMGIVQLSVRMIKAELSANAAVVFRLLIWRITVLKVSLSCDQSVFSKHIESYSAYLNDVIRLQTMSTGRDTHTLPELMVFCLWSQYFNYMFTCACQSMRDLEQSLCSIYSGHLTQSAFMSLYLILFIQVKRSLGFHDVKKTPCLLCVVIIRIKLEQFIIVLYSLLKFQVSFKGFIMLSLNEKST